MKHKHAIAFLLNAIALAAVACEFTTGNPEVPHTGQLDATTGPIHVGAIEPITWAKDLSDASNLQGQVVVGLENEPLPPLDAGVTGALEWDGSSWYLGAAGGGGGVTPGDAGQFFVTNDAGTATAWVYPSGDVQASTTNPGQLTVESISGNSPLPITPSTLAWGMSVSSPTLTQTTPSSNLTPQNLEVHAQYPWASATGSGRLPGSVTMSLSDPFSQLYGGFLIQYGTTPLIRFGEYGGNTTDSGVIWFKDGGSPSTTNYGIRGTSSALLLNAPSGGTLSLQAGGTTYANVASTGLTIPALGGSGSGIATVSNAGLLGFATSASLFTAGGDLTGTATTQYIATLSGNSSATAPVDLTGTYLGLNGSISTYPTLGQVRNSDHAGTGVNVIGAEYSGTTYVAMSQDANVLTIGADYNDAHNFGFTYMVGNALGLYAATAGVWGVYVQPSSSSTDIGSSVGTTGVVVAWGTTPSVLGGSSATSVGFGSNKVAATTVLSSDANQTTLTLDWANSLATFASGVNVKVTAAYEDVSQMTAPSVPAANTQRIYTDSADGKLKVQDHAGNITVLSP